MNGLSYQRLAHITNTVPHYRGNKNRFPLGSRRENRKYFLVREEGNDIVFDIVYGTSWQSHDCDKATYEAKIAEGHRGHSYPDYDAKGQVIPDSFRYYWYETPPNVLGTVRPDGTFQFTSDVYGQGDRMFLSNFCTGWFTTESRRGGMVHKSSYNSSPRKLLPIWKGMKINIADMTSVEPYKVVIHHVNRKAAKELLAKYEHFFKVSEVMTKNMEMSMLSATAKEVLNDLYQKEDAYSDWHKGSELLAAAEERINSAPLDAFVLFALGYDIGRFNYTVRWLKQGTTHGYGYGERESVEALFANTKRKLSKEIYKANRDIFKEVEYEAGQVYPNCDWGVKIIVNGQEMEQL